MIYGEKNSLNIVVSIFAIRTSQRPEQKSQKSFHLKEIKKYFQNIFSNASKKNKNRNAQPTLK
jgi:hypothetical protein